MDHPIMEYLSSSNAEDEMFEQLFKEVCANQLDHARITAAKISAARDIRFDLLKITREYDNRRRDSQKSGKKETT